ncbi:alpha/beta fold hydrolase [Shewanella algidipiscicola]|uniref:Alpha/beta hydrolase n=1 Tax=Shewanella algidipiscicola TaxID=614070 RepID=A0ABQ4P491_9GAMM|nr:alpha/beta fold hydrolase [Shewanella algidipiscicola]GIU42302.1 alpha/beta hydrolase [Shewanella algidipiscicola]
MQQSLYIPYRQGQLHLKQLKLPDADMSQPPILMLHGAMSNGRVFYSDSGKGLGCYLAQAGFVVYVLDTLGRGLSTPKLAAGANHGQGEVIREQLPLVQHYILSQHPHAGKVHWCGHSWGGVLMASAIARFDFFQHSVASLLTFGSKRAIKVRSFKKWLMVDVAWNTLAPAIAKGHGYLAADRWRMGMDNESKASLAQSIDWVRGDWIDHDDGFNYAEAAKQLGSSEGWPKAWFIAGLGDAVLGNPADVQRMLAECHCHDVDYTLLSKANGYRHDYGHAEMLTHKDACDDHFPLVLNWYLCANGADK